MKRLKVLEQENGRLRRAVADLTLENLVLKGETAKRVNRRETGERPLSSGVRCARHGQAGRVRVFCLQGDGSAPFDAAPGAGDGRR